MKKPVNKDNFSFVNKIKKWYLYLGVLALFLLFGISYAIVYFYHNESMAHGDITTGVISINASEEGIVSLTDTLPMSDVDGLNGSYKTIEITNTSGTNVDFSLKLVPSNYNEIPIDSIRYGLYINDNLKDVDYVSSDGNIYNGILQRGEVIVFKVYLWIDYNYNGTGLKFSAYFDAEANTTDMLGTEYIERLANKDKGLYIINTDGSLYDGTGTIRDYRYSGKDADNYVWFNCDDGYTSGTEHCELWRIVGVENVVATSTSVSYDRIKIVQDGTTNRVFNSSLANYSDSSIRTYLNNQYYSGLSENAKKMILESEWGIGNVSVSGTANSNYNSEDNSLIYDMVGLLSASDIGYSFAPDKYNSALNNSSAYSSSWLTGKKYYTLNSTGTTGNIINDNGSSITSSSSNALSYAIPAVYLSPMIRIIAGNGTKDKPYQLMIGDIINYYGDIGKPTTPVITRTSFNTFGYSATDNVAVTGYYVSSSSVKPTIYYSEWVTTTNYEINGPGTYYVWACDAAGNISDAGTINAYNITRSQGEGTTLTTRYDSTSSTTGTVFTDNMVMLAGTPIWAKAEISTGYSDLTLKHGTTSLTTNGATFNVNSAETITSGASDGIAPSTPTITRIDYNTFEYSATDNVGVTGYYVSTSNTTPTTSSSWVTALTNDVSAAGTYYVWARDNAGNISEQPATIDAYTITRSQASNTTLTTRLESTSSSTGVAFTTDTVMLEGTDVWAKATITNYNTVILKLGSTLKNKDGFTFTVDSNKTISTLPPFTVSSGSFTYLNTGYYKITADTTIVPSENINVDVFLVGGGGGGGSNDGYYGGGGGAGGCRMSYRDVALTKSTSYNIVIGAGGTGASGSDGGSTSAFGKSVAGGKKGNGKTGGDAVNTSTCVSTGGPSGKSNAAGPSGSPGGYPFDDSAVEPYLYGASGGASGGNSSGTSTSATSRAGGAGGSDGGGGGYGKAATGLQNKAVCTFTSCSGAANSGGGGGGGSHNSVHGDGGSGVVIFTVSSTS